MHKVQYTICTIHLKLTNCINVFTECLLHNQFSTKLDLHFVILLKNVMNQILPQTTFIINVIMPQLCINVSPGDVKYLYTDM